MDTHGTARATPQWLARVLRGAATPRTAAAQLLFHGTLEKFAGRLVASEWEGVRWATSDPAVAQAYCPETGLLSGWSAPMSFRLADRFVPNNDIERIIFIELGFDEEALDIQRDRHGIATSWRVLPNHPTNADAQAFITSLGYDVGSGFCWLKTAREGNREVILRADHKEKGRLFILERPSGLRILNYADSADGGLSGQQWMNTGLFKTASQTGVWDGIEIDDVHKSTRLGHFGHRSIGLFDKTLARLRYYEIEAVNADPAESWTANDGRTTPEFDALWAVFHPEIEKLAA